MVYLSPFGLGSLLRIGRSRRRHPQKRCRSRAVKAVASPVKFNVINNNTNKFGSRLELNPHGRKRKQKEEETKEKRRRGNGCCDHYTISDSSSNILNLNENIVVWEILSRLPVKSLMRFKCVCKYWLFLIQEDPSFIALHLNRSKTRPGLFIANEKDNKDTFMTADLWFEGRGGAISAAVIHTIREIDSTSYDRMLEPVNGLIGFFGQEITPGVRICNLSTREVTPWIKSTLLSKLREEERGYSQLNIPLADCNLGYDPATKEHKVIGIWQAYQPDYEVCEVCEVLTVGDNEWRKIDEIPPYKIEYYGSTVYLNGSIYYTTYMLTYSKADDKDKPKFLVAFDVGSEKFRAIRVPNIIFDQPVDGGGTFIFHEVKLLELDGQLALIVKLCKIGYSPKLWLFDDDYNKENAKGTWTEVPMELPFTLGEGRSGSFYPVLGTDQIILTSSNKFSDSKILDTTHHSYNWKKLSFNEIEISGIPPSVPYFSSARSRVATFFESLWPVQKQTTSTLRRKFTTIF